MTMIEHINNAYGREKSGSIWNAESLSLISSKQLERLLRGPTLHTFRAWIGSLCSAKGHFAVSVYIELHLKKHCTSFEKLI